MTLGLRIVPLGGLGEVGMNCMAIQSDDDIVVVDCGVMFPEGRNGADLIHPDFAWLRERRDLVRGVVITHGHEDHIGALPHLLREMNVPVFGPRYALALARDRLAEQNVEATLTSTTPRTAFRLGRIEIEPIQVTHSIVDATALAFRTRQGIVVHTGDFKIDATPPNGQLFDFARFSEIGKEGVRLLLSDSTNADVEGASRSELVVGEALQRVIGSAPRRVVLGIFASNVDRIRAAIVAAQATGRRVCMLGRSAQKHLRTAMDLGYLPDVSHLLVAPVALREIPPERILVIAGGTQGETRGALNRLATGHHPDLALEEGDTVILSARAIPGNERRISEMVDGFERRGAHVRFRATDGDIHVSGHAQRQEQQQMIELTEPRGFLPIHGGYHQLRRHAELARELGIADALVVENGAEVLVGDAALAVVDQVQTGRVFVDDEGELAQSVLSDRSVLGEHGIATGAVAVDEDGYVLDARVTARGVVPDGQQEAAAREAERAITEAAEEHTRDPDWNEAGLRDAVRRALRRYFSMRTGRKPVAQAIVLKVRP